MTVMAAPAPSHPGSTTNLPPLAASAFVAFVGDAPTRERVEVEVSAILADRAPLHVVDGGLIAAMETAAWPEGLGGLILDIADSPSPVGDMAALMGSVPEDAVVIAIGDANDVELFRDLVGTGVADYLVRPLAEGALNKALDKALTVKSRDIELRNAQATLQAAAASGLSPAGGANDAAPLVVACIGTRGGAGTTTLAIALASMLGQARDRESLIVDLDLHYGSVMLALDLDPTDALQEALTTPDRVDNLFVDQTVQRKGDLLCALGAEEAPQSASASKLDQGAIPKVMGVYQRRFRQIVLDVPRANPLLQRQALQAATDLVLVCDLTLVGARDAMRLLSLAAEAAPQMRTHIVASGVVDPRKAPIKLADLERSVKQKVVCQIAYDDKGTAAAVNAGKPVNEFAPRGAIARSIQPLVGVLMAAVGGGTAGKPRSSFLSKLMKPKSRSNPTPARAGA
jgi:pilus assembly protein CpaE